MLELSDVEFTTTMIHMLKAPVDEAAGMQEEVTNTSRDKEILGKNPSPPKARDQKHCNRSEE